MLYTAIFLVKSVCSTCTGGKCHPVKFGSHDISWTISCTREHNVPAPNKTCKKLLVEKIANEDVIASCFCIIWWLISRIEMVSWMLHWNEGHPWDLCPPQKPTATGNITKAATGIKNWFKRGKLTLSSSVLKNKLLYSSASNMLAIKHNTKSANTKNAAKAAALVPLAMVAMATKSLKLIGTSHLEDLQRLMAMSTRRRPKMRL